MIAILCSLLCFIIIIMIMALISVKLRPFTNTIADDEQLFVLQAKDLPLPMILS